MNREKLGFSLMARFLIAKPDPLWREAR